VRKKLIGRRPIPGITFPGRLDHIVDVLFSRHPIKQWPAKENPDPFPEITTEEIMRIADSIPIGKAPGLDGIPDLVIKAVAKGRPDIFCKVYNRCLSEGNFPEAWKSAKLVFLPKGNKPLEQPSSYRPICLLNTVGKLFERIVKCRLETHLETQGGLNEKQFGFRRGRSTVDAIHRVMETIEAKSTGPLRRRELCVLVALDVANAFNTAN